MRLIDVENFDVLSMQNKSDDFVAGVEWLVEQIDNAPTVDAIPIPDSATNGDIIKALFDGQYGTNGNMVMVWGNNQSVSFSLDWWNAPYNGGSKNGNDD